MGKLLAEQQIQSFRREGYVAPVEVLSPAEAAAALSAYEDYERQHWGFVGRAYDDQEGREFLRQPQRRARWAYDLVQNTRVLDAIEDLLGRDILVWDAKLFPKQARSKSYVSWHQDGTYINLQPMSQVVTAWIALTNSLPDNGCMRVLPGSHCWGQLDHAKTHADGNLLLHGQVIEREFDTGSLVDVALRAGEMSIHDMMLIHGSGENCSNHRRIGISVNYVTPKVIETNNLYRASILARGRDQFGHFRLFSWPPRAEDLVDLRTAQGGFDTTTR
jgi:ectoine hydroxylase-related dioxygenase (phytanoyl-CoA dioxygenase family)